MASWPVGWPAQTGLRANDFLGAAARHFELAGDEGNAAEYHARAAEQARTRMAHDAVLDHVQQALALLDRSPATGTALLRWRLLEVREVTLDMQGERVGQRADIDAMVELAEAQDDDRRRAHAALRRSALAQRLADYAAMEAARDGLSNGRVGRATTRFDCSRVDCWRWRSPSRAGPAKVGSSRRRPWPKHARWHCAASKACV